MREARIIDKLAEIVIQMGRTHEATCHIRKDKIAVFPLLASFSPLPLLRDLMLFEKSYVKLRQVYEAFACFCFRVSLNVAKGINVINGMKHNKDTPLQINVGPTKGKDFPPPHAGDNGSHDYQLQPVSFQRFDQSFRLLNR